MRYWFSRGLLSLQHACYIRSRLQYKKNPNSTVKGNAQESLAEERMIFVSDLMRYLALSIRGVMPDILRHYCIISTTNQYNKVSASMLAPSPPRCFDVIYFSDLVIPPSCVKVQWHSVTEMDWAVNLPHRSPQTYSLCHRYPEAAATSFPPFPREHWQVRGLDKSYISLSLQISHHEGVLLYLSLSRSLLALFSMETNGIVPLNKEPGVIKPPARFSK